MPHITVVIGAEGPVIDLGVAVGRSWHRLQRIAQE